MTSGRAVTHRPMPTISLPGIFAAFLRLGATAYGGPAMMAHLHQACVNRPVDR